MKRENHSKRHEDIVWVEESPIPTRRFSTSPWPQTTKKHAARSAERGGGIGRTSTRAYMQKKTKLYSLRTFACMRRAGLRRYASHCRMHTRAYNPRTRTDCAYMCVLKAASLPSSSEAIQALRLATSDIIREHFIQDKYLAGVRVGDVINDSHETLAAYLAHIKHNQLASQIEVAAAAQATGVSICLSMGNWCGMVGHL